MKTAFVTGAASGFGFHLARRLLEDGYRVFATDAEVDGLADRLGGHPESLRIVRLDVRRADEVASAVAEALTWSPPDVLVNNAGYAIFGTQEETDLEAVRDLFDVNVLGPARLTQALLPTLRARRGTLVQLSSVAGRTVFPESGFYAATKYALEALSEALFQEVCTFGVRVRVIEPGSFDTGFLTRAAAASRPRSPSSPYAGLHPTWDARKFGVLERPQDPGLVVAAIVGSLDHEAPFLRVPVGPDAERLLSVRDALPADAWVMLAAERNGLPATRPRGPGEVLAPAAVLEIVRRGEDRSVLGPTLAAYRHRHLDHWAGLDDGPAALESLRSLLDQTGG